MSSRDVNFNGWHLQRCNVVSRISRQVYLVEYRAHDGENRHSHTNQQTATTTTTTTVDIS